MPERIFVLGGTRSGKSRYGRERARALGSDAVTFIATAVRGDAELDARIAAHRANRPAAWTTIEADADLPAAIAAAAADHVLLIDSLTLWLSLVLERDRPARDLWGRSMELLDQRIRPVIVVSDEIGLGMVPLDAAARAYRDELGVIHQRAAAWADEVFLLVAGIATRLKGG